MNFSWVSSNMFYKKSSVVSPKQFEIQESRFCLWLVGIFSISFPALVHDTSLDLLEMFPYGRGVTFGEQFMIQKVSALVHILSININDYFSDFIHLNVSKELLSGFRSHASNFGLKIVVIALIISAV
jgi:hypothetical protein